MGLTGLVWLLLVAGCGVLPTAIGASPPPQAPPDSRLQVDGFQLATESNHATAGSTLHIYLPGDGRVRDIYGAATDDPTPDRSVALELARRDPQRAVFLARPCQYLSKQNLSQQSLSEQAGCDPLIWTHGRYGAGVIAATCQAIEMLAERHGSRVTLVGFSGGGAVAALASRCAPSVVNLITINGNLDIEYWAQQRGFIPLLQSDNPYDHPLPEYVSGRIYLVGAQDAVVPPATSARFADRQGGELLTFPEFDHRCCWADQWPEILKRLEGQLDY